MTFFWSATLDKKITSYKPPDQRIKKTKEEKIGSEENNSSRVTMPKSFDFEDMWSFNHPHLSVKERW
jgi:hypothetical protein